MKTLMLASALSSMTLLGCVAAEKDSDTGKFDPALLEEYRAVLPKMERLQAEAPQASAASILALGETAELPAGSYDIAIGINGAVTGIIGVLDEVTKLEPTVFNSETQEFFWGPFPNDNGDIGYVAAYIREAGPDADFRFEYALLRGIDNDVANLTPVIWGGATPDENNEDHGVGVTLWDFEANRAFEQEHNPMFDSLVLDRGRFVALYAAGPDEKDPEAEVAFVLAAFRDFVPADNAGAAPADLDYFYGRYENGITIDFIDYETAFDVTEPVDGLNENVGVRMAFLNEGTGRAEADATGGSLEEGAQGRVVECWNAAIEQTFVSFEITGGTTPIGPISEGNPADCGLFTASLSELGVPSLDDVEPELRDALDQAASNGIPQ